MKKKSAFSWFMHTTHPVDPFLLFILAIVVVIQASPAGASGTVAQDKDARSDYGEFSTLQQYAEPRLKTGHAAMEPVIRFMDPYFSFKELLADRIGLNFMIEYAPLFQGDLKGNEGITAGDETNAIVQWAPFNRNQPNQGSLLAWYQYQNTWTDNNTSEFMQKMGNLSPINGGVTGPNNNSSDFLQHFAWEQWLGQDKFRVMIGKMTTRVMLNINRYAVSDRMDFFSPMLVNNPVAMYTARIGLGAFAQYRPGDWYLSGMVRQANGTSRWFKFDELESDELEYVGEFALTPDNFMGLGEGNYRITPSYTDRVGHGATTQPSGWSLSFSFDQDIGERFGALFRYAYGFEDFRVFRQRMALGTQIKKPLGFEFDRIGLAGWWGKPTNAALDSEYGLEAFWMIQVAPFMELTADIQTIIDPALDDSNFAWIGGLRVRIVL